MRAVLGTAAGRHAIEFLEGIKPFGEDAAVLSESMIEKLSHLLRAIEVEAQGVAISVPSVWVSPPFEVSDTCTCQKAPNGLIPTTVNCPIHGSWTYTGSTTA